MRYVLNTVCVLGLTLAAHAGEDDASVSLAPAARLAMLLDVHALDAFAAADPETPGRYAAVLYFPRIQMLTVAGTYAAPALLDALLAKGDYRQVYLDLSTAAAREGRLFVEDFGAPGIRPSRQDDMPFDRVWRDTTRQVTYDGEWVPQKLSEAAYRDRFAADDADYAHVLQVLIDGLGSRYTAVQR